MNYYIAKDRFGNLDLCHYGIKGMKWGEVNEDHLSGPNYAAKKAQIDGQKRTAQLKAQQVSSKPSSSPLPKAQTKQTAKLTEQAVKAEQAQEAPVAASPKEKALADKISDANVAYQTALTQMQLLSRISLANGISPSADPEYIKARKEVIKAKYELDQLKLQQQEEAAKNPPTMAEQKQYDDSAAKEKLSEDKKKSSGKKYVNYKYSAVRQN